jgi:hypothetical protein
MIAALPHQSVPNPAQWMMQQIFLDPLKKSANATIVAALRSAEAAFITPDVTTVPRVGQIWQALLLVADSLLVVLLVVGAIMVTAGEWGYGEVKQLVPRFVVAGTAVNFSMIVMGIAISMSNTVVRALLQVPQNSLSVTTAGLLQGGALSPLVLAIALILAIGLLIANVMRIVLLLILAVGAPVLLCFGTLPHTEAISRAWWRALAACLVAPMIQAMLLLVAVEIFFTPGGGLESVGFSGAITDLIVVEVFLLMLAITPLWMMKKAIGIGAHHVKTGLMVVGAVVGA